MAANERRLGSLDQEAHPMTEPTPHPVAQLLVTQLEFNHRTLHINVDGFVHEDSLRQLDPGGNCLNWIVGHLVSTRNRTLELVGQTMIWDDETAALYRRQSEGITADAPGVLQFSRILADFDTSQGQILEGLLRMGADQLEEEATGSSIEKAPAKQLAGLIWHEGYHVGQTGLIRRLLGEKGAIY
jgi:hypothetical protein